MTAFRRLAAILASDVAGYSRLIGADEEGTINRLKSIRTEVVDPKIAEYRGRLVKATGDGLLVEFASVIDALRCATEWQRGMAERNAVLPDAIRMKFRIGINVGDIVVEEGDIFGDGVNVAARLESLAEPGGVCVSARVQEDTAGRLDLTFEDMGEQHLKNIARPVRTYRVRATSADETPTVQPTDTHPALALPEKPSIAVLPFQNMSGDLEQEYFADGMVEEIITALSRIRWLFVIARNSSITYKGHAIDVTRVGRELGVRYVLEGSVRKGGGRVRITAQLIEAATGTHLWADRFDGSLEDIFELQDKVAISVAGVIEPTLQAAETARLASHQTPDLTAYDLYLRAYEAYWRSMRHLPEALGFAEQAIARDPRYGPALAWAATCCFRLLVSDRSEDREADRQKGIDFARRALEVAGDDSATLANAAFALAYFGEDIAAMIGLVDRALVLNPSFARGWHISGALRQWAGDYNIAIQHIETSMRLSPRARVGPALLIMGSALFFARRFEEALSKLLLAIQDDPSNPMAHRALVSCYAHMGYLSESREILLRLRNLTQVVLPDVSFLRDVEQRDLFLSGLRLAMSQDVDE